MTKYTVEELVNMHFQTEAKGNGREARKLYEQWFPTRCIRSHPTPYIVDRQLRKTAEIFRERLRSYPWGLYLLHFIRYFDPGNMPSLLRTTASQSIPLLIQRDICFIPDEAPAQFSIRVRNFLNDTHPPKMDWKRSTCGLASRNPTP
ncbi:hypothetical protein TNCV_4006331 [Trichonephila clavipes]|nr:hypothetical protein TNCV_4006331 [Trichonephila clavipes]